MGGTYVVVVTRRVQRAAEACASHFERHRNPLRPTPPHPPHIRSRRSRQPRRVCTRSHTRRRVAQNEAEEEEEEEGWGGSVAPDGGWGVPVATRPSFGGCTLTLKDGDVERSSVPPHVPRRNRTHTAVNSVRLPPDDAPQTISNRASERPAVI